MYCLLKIDANNSMHPAEMQKSSYDLLVDGYTQLGELFDLFKELHQYRGALIDLEMWCRNDDSSAADLLLNQETAERLCQSVLSAFKNYYTHIGTKIKEKHGEGSTFGILFKDLWNNARKTSDEFTFAYKLRNYSQHEKEVVHSFLETKNYLQPASSPSILLTDTNRWNLREKAYILAHPDGVDLLDAFEKSYDTLGVVHQSMVQYILDNTDAGANLQMLRKWMDETFVRTEAKYYSLAEVTRKDGTEANMSDYRNAVPDLIFKALAIDWDTIYEITDSLTERK